MRINGITLHNIRSYRDAHIEFPEGSVLLAGDVGAGKSSILLAMEFALFGIKRGELSGESLLRRGQNNGSVTLNLTLNGTDVEIERTLTRTPDGVRQDSGGITIGGVTHPGTARELKANVLELFGYPQELVRKQKSLLYRYTVYTPQEEMKRIIFADKDDRLDTLRKVFRVDRYKTMRENISDFLAELRGKKRILKMVYKTLEETKEEEKEKVQELEETRKVLQEIGKKLEAAEKEEEKWKRKREEIEERVRRYNRLDKELAEKKVVLGETEKNLARLRKTTKEYEEEIRKIEDLETPTDKSEADLQQEIEETRDLSEQYVQNPEEIDEEIRKLVAQTDEKEQEADEARKKLTESKTRIESLKESIQELQEAKDTCPVCGQHLDEKHKRDKISEYEDDIKEWTDEIDRLNDVRKELEEETEGLKEKIRDRVKAQREKFAEKEKLLTDTLEQLKKYKEKQKEREEIAEALEEENKKEEKEREKVKETKGTIASLKDELEELEDVEDQRKKIDDELERIGDRIRDLKASHATQQERRKNLRETLDKLHQQIQEMKEAKNFRNSLSDYESWLQEYLVKLTETMERHFMHQLRQSFDPLFRDWFDLLIEDQDLTVRIDDQFSPLIEQQGYQVDDYGDLSGGEKTSVALAYRLALNKVINTMVEDIKTNDVIILDEPTDGFSTDQLDKVRDILDQLDIPQTIIVSHEPKVESYVEHIINIRKEAGTSEVVQ